MLKYLFPLTVILAPPAIAQDQIVIPAGCTALATVHKNSCMTTTVLSCEDGTRRALTFRRGRLANTSQFDANWSFIRWETQGAGAMQFSFVPGTGVVMDVAALKAVGNHEPSGDFVINSKIIRDQEYSLTGYTQATGIPFELDGETFDQYVAERAFKVKGGQKVLNFTTEVLISRSRDLMIEGNWGRAVNYGKWDNFDFTPRAIYGPGDTGFLTTVSEYGCG